LQRGVISIWRLHEDDVKNAESLIAQAKQKEKCAAQAQALQDAIDALKEAAKFTLGEKLAIAAILGGGVLGGILSGGTELGLVVAFGAAGLSELGVLANHTARVKSARDALLKATRALQDCLSH
jgi:hypothetical protein